MGPNANKQRIEEVVGAGRKHKSTDGRSSSDRDPVRQKPSKIQRAGVEPFREKQQPGSGDGGVVKRGAIGGQVEACKGKGKGKGKADESKREDKGKGKSAIDNIFADMKRLKRARDKEEVERCAVCLYCPVNLAVSPPLLLLTPTIPAQTHTGSQSVS